jgi:hypothetical protein
MCIVPKFIIDWFMIMVLLVLKLFVSSRALKLECVLCIYVLLFHKGQAENHCAMFFNMVETHTWLSMLYYSWSFVCVTFHVITWLLHACFYTICLVFRYTSWHFYAFSGTNLLTRCHSASSLFSAIFVFQKSYTGNILGNGRNKSQRTEEETEWGHKGPTQQGDVAQG